MARLIRWHDCTSNDSGTCFDCPEVAAKAKTIKVAKQRADETARLAEKRAENDARLATEAKARRKPLHSLSATDRETLRTDPTRRYTVALRWVGRGEAEVRIVVASPKGFGRPWAEAKGATWARKKATDVNGTPKGFAAALLTFGEAERIERNASRHLEPANPVGVYARRRRA